METENAKPSGRHELFGFLEEHPGVLSEHARWLASGGEEILARLLDSVRGDMFPYAADQHVQAAYGAFVGGATMVVRLLRKLVSVAGNRAETARVIAQAEGALSDAERDTLLTLYGYSEKDLEKYTKTREGGR